jgi:hypothetical protein
MKTVWLACGALVEVDHATAPREHAACSSLCRCLLSLSDSFIGVHILNIAQRCDRCESRPTEAA